MIAQGFKDRVGNTLSSSSDFVNFLYEHIHGASASSEGMTHYSGLLDSGQKTQADLVLEFLESDEGVEAFREHTIVVMCYLGLLNREAEKAGFNFYMNLLGRGSIDQLTILINFLNSPEYQNRLDGFGCSLPN